jgi:hypothetical protein
MKTEKFWRLVFQKALKGIKSREFENRKIFFWIVLGIVFFIVLLLIPGIDFFIELLLLILPPVIKIIFSFLNDFLFVIPQNIYMEKLKEINNLQEKYISPDISFNVLRLGEAYKNGERYASVVVVNNEEFSIESFIGIIVGVEFENSSGNNNEFINYINPGGRPLMIDGEDNNSITLIPSGGRARFNIAKGDGNQISFLTNNNIRSINYGESLKVTIKFSGVAKGSYITPIEKAYSLGCTYKDIEKKTGIKLVRFENY